MDMRAMTRATIHRALPPTSDLPPDLRNIVIKMLLVRIFYQGDEVQLLNFITSTLASNYPWLPRWQIAPIQAYDR
jgi:hypothetical protein